MSPMTRALTALADALARDVCVSEETRKAAEVLREAALDIASGEEGLVGQRR